jgi:hypothetical protein
MAFSQSLIDDLLARTGRMCAVCQRRHGVQVHHIVPVSEGGSDDPGNAIPLCPNCHSEVHASYAAGRTTRLYTEAELRGHLERTIALARSQEHLARGNDDWNRDVELIRFYRGCLDRPAFRMHFYNELSFAEFDDALEDTVLAISTGLWRTRDGAVIERSAGKGRLVNPSWRDRMDAVVEAIVQARHELRQALGLNQMLVNFGDRRSAFDWHDQDLRHDMKLGTEIDRLRQQALDAMNQVLAQAGLPTLKAIES